MAHTALSPLPGNSPIGIIGDSIAQGLGSATSTNSYEPINCLHEWANTYSGCRCYIPRGANKGVGGEGIETIAARFTADMGPLNLKAIILVAGYNSTGSMTSAEILSYFDAMILAARAMGSYLIIVPILPGTAQTGAADTVRLAVNLGLVSRASPWVRILDISGYDYNIHTYAEALPPVGYHTHPNVLGTQLLGPRISTELNSLFRPYDPSLAPTDPLNKIGLLGGMPGTGGTTTLGTLTNVSGSIATGWNLDGTNGAGAVVALSKGTSQSGNVSQRVVISGNYSGSGKNIALTTGSVALPGVAIGDLVEITYELEFDAGAVNVDGVGMFAFMQSAGFAFLSQCSHMVTNTSNNSGAVSPGVIRAVFRSMAFQSPSTTPAYINIIFSAYLREGGSSSPCSASFGISKVAVRKI